MHPMYTMYADEHHEKDVQHIPEGRVEQGPENSWSGQLRLVNLLLDIQAEPRVWDARMSMYPTRFHGPSHEMHSECQ